MAILDHFAFDKRPDGIDADHARNILLPNGQQFTYAFVWGEFEDYDVRKHGHYGILPCGSVFPMQGGSYVEEFDDERAVQAMGAAMAWSLQRPRISAEQWDTMNRKMGVTR